MEYNNDPTGPLEAVMRASREGNLNSEAFGGPRVEVDEKTRAVLESLQSLTTGGGANAFVGASNAALVQDSAEEFVDTKLNNLDPDAVRVVMEELQRQLHGPDVQFAEPPVPPAEMVVRVEGAYRKLEIALTGAPPEPDLRPASERIEALAQVAAFLLDERRAPPVKLVVAKEGNAGQLERRMVSGGGAAGQKVVDTEIQAHRSPADPEALRAGAPLVVFRKPPPPVAPLALAGGGKDQPTASSSEQQLATAGGAAAQPPQPPRQIHRVMRIKNARGNLINNVPDGYVPGDFPKDLMALLRRVELDAGGGDGGGGGSGGGATAAAAPAAAAAAAAAATAAAAAGGGGKGVKLGATDFGAGSLASALVDSDDEEEESEPLGGGAGEHCSPLDGSLGGSGRGGGIPEKGPVSIVSMVSAVDASCRAFQAKLESAPLLPCALCGELGADHVPVGFGDWYRDFPSCEHHYHKRCILGMMVWYDTAPDLVEQKCVICQTPFGGYTRANTATSKWLLMKGTTRLLEEVAKVRRERCRKQCRAAAEAAVAAGAAYEVFEPPTDAFELTHRALAKCIIHSGYGLAATMALPVNECPPVDLNLDLACCESGNWLGAANLGIGGSLRERPAHLADAPVMGYSAAEIDGQLHLAMARAFSEIGGDACADAEREADRSVRLLQTMQRTRQDKRVHPSRKLYNEAMQLRMEAKEKQKLLKKEMKAIKAGGGGSGGGKKKKKGGGGKKKKK